jgi:hypothetical protein
LRFSRSNSCFLRLFNSSASERKYGERGRGRRWVRGKGGKRGLFENPSVASFTHKLGEEEEEEEEEVII